MQKNLPSALACSRSEQKKPPIRYPGNITGKWPPTIGRCQSSIRTWLSNRPRGIENLAPVHFGVTVTRREGAVEPFETGLDDGNLVFDLTDWRTEIVAGSELEIDGQPLSMHPKIFQGAPVIQPDINVGDLLNCCFHSAPKDKRCGHYLTKQALLHPPPIASAATTGFIRSISTASQSGIWLLQ